MSIGRPLGAIKNQVKKTKEKMRFYKAKEVEKIIDCDRQFIPFLTKTFNNRKHPLFKPTFKGTQGVASLFSFIDILTISFIYECRKFGIKRDILDVFAESLKNGPIYVLGINLEKSPIEEFVISIFITNHDDTDPVLQVSIKKGLSSLKMLVTRENSDSDNYHWEMNLSKIQDFTSYQCSEFKVDINKLIKNIKSKSKVLEVIV